MHGMARLVRYRPNERWLLAYAQEAGRWLHQLPASDVVDVLAALVSMGYQPPERWMAGCLGRLQPALAAPHAPAPHAPAPVAAPVAVPVAASVPAPAGEEASREDAGAAAAAPAPAVGGSDGGGAAAPPLRMEGRRRRVATAGAAAMPAVEGMEAVAALFDQLAPATEVPAPPTAAEEQGQEGAAGQGLEGGEGVAGGAGQQLAERCSSHAAASGSSRPDAPAAAGSGSGSSRAPTARAAAAARPLTAMWHAAKSPPGSEGGSDGCSSSELPLAPPQLALLAWSFCALDFLPPPPWMELYVRAIYDQV